jgi:NAD(P)H-flavin reductase
VALIFAIRMFFKKRQEAQDKLREKEQSYLVPEEGGVLQKNSKDADGNIKLRLGAKIKITHDTYIFRFSFSDPDYTFGLPIGQHVIFSANIPTTEHPEGELIERKYTPITTVRHQSYVDFVIKIYRKNVHPRFPDGGIMTQYLEGLSQGQEMLMCGPKGRLCYEGFGKIKISGKLITKKTIGLVSGGTGITPCY